MPQYAAILYSRDADWTSPAEASSMEQYGSFSEANGDHIRGGAALFPTSTATTIRVAGARGGEVVTSDGPYAETKEVLGGFFMLECPTSTKRSGSLRRSRRRGTAPSSSAP